jgi:hypothetical protein
MRDVGTGMGDDEVSDLSARLDLVALRGYYTAVGRRTLEVVRSLRPEPWMSSPTCNACARKASSGITPYG